MPVGTCDPATRGELFNVRQIAKANGDVQLTVRFGWDGRPVAGVGIVSGSAALTAPTGSFTAEDLGRGITGTGIPAGALITAVVSGSSAAMDVPATATGSITATVGSARNSPGGCDGPLVNGTGPASNRWAVRAESTSGVPWYAHTTRKNGQPVTYTLNPGQVVNVSAQQAAAGGYTLASDFGGLDLTTDPTHPGG
jgi:hypothetical protein